MQFDPNNKIVKLCAKGIEMEAHENALLAKEIFLQAWEEASDDTEKFIAAHYVARHQKTVEDKLKWDKIALEFALKINDNDIQSNYPSLYLNIAKCYEDIGDMKNAHDNYLVALSFVDSLPVSGYGQMIKSGVEQGLQRTSR